MFEKESQFYQENKQTIREKYLGKYVVIIGSTILGAYDDVGEAYREAAKTNPPGSFMIQDIPVDIEDETACLSPFAF